MAYPANGKILFLPAVIPLIFFLNVECKLQCKNKENVDVDWFVSYKWPKDKKSENTLIKKGTGFSSVSADVLEKGWIFSNNSINVSESLIGLTLLPLYTQQGNDDMLWILYNDETPNKTVSFVLGHTKGVILANDQEGIWLVHSVPHFPPLPSSKYSYPLSGIKFGQSFLCISLKSSEIDKIGKQLKYNEPQIYSSNVPQNLVDKYPNLVSAVEKSWIKSAPWYQLEELTTSSGQIIKSFAKSRKFKKELYADWVAPSLNVGLLVETWPNGRGHLPSSCKTPFSVYNVRSIALKNSSILFSQHVDHSKWGIAIESSQPWVCVGDINRMITQEERGGGTLCIKQIALWKRYKELVHEIENCPTV